MSTPVKESTSSPVEAPGAPVKGKIHQPKSETPIVSKKLDEDLKKVPFQKNTKRCFKCNTKVCLQGITCSYCNFIYCIKCRLPEEHKCDVDYRALGQTQLRAALPGGGQPPKMPDKL